MSIKVLPEKMTVVVEGVDRSQIEMIREKYPSYRVLWAEKKIVFPPLEAELPEKKYFPEEIPELEYEPKQEEKPEPKPKLWYRNPWIWLLIGLVFWVCEEN